MTGQADVVETRPRGRPRAIEERELIEAARRLGPDGLDLQSVGDAIGVARTSLYYHVRNSDELGRKVLEALVDDESANDWLLPSDAPWEAWLRAYAVEFRRVLHLVAPWLRYATPSSLYTRRRLESVNRLIGRLVDDGFSIDEASAAVRFVSLIAQSSLTAIEDLDVVRAQVAASDPHELVWIRRGLTAMNRADAEELFRAYVDQAIAGISASRETTTHE